MVKLIVSQQFVCEGHSQGWRMFRADTEPIAQTGKELWLGSACSGSLHGMKGNRFFLQLSQVLLLVCVIR